MEYSHLTPICLAPLAGGNLTGSQSYSIHSCPPLLRGMPATQWVLSKPLRSEWREDGLQILQRAQHPGNKEVRLQLNQ
jgi:hypothetical protein